MNADKFVAAVVEQVHVPAIEDTLSQLDGPSGRRPPKKVADTATWYASLSDQEKTSVKSVVELAVHGTLFGFLCALDGVRTLHESPEDELHLCSVKNGASTRLNAPEGESLHDIYQALVYSRVFE